VCCSSVLQWCVSVVCQHRRWVSCSSELQCFVTIRTCKKACWLPRCHVLQHTAADCKTLQHTAPHLMHQSSLTALMHCTAPHWTTLHHTAPHSTTLHHTSTHCNTLQHTVTHRHTLQHATPHCKHTTTHYNTCQHTTYLTEGFLIATLRPPRCTTLHYTTLYCKTLQHTATHCIPKRRLSDCLNAMHNTHYNTLQYTATHCNTLQHTAYLTEGFLNALMRCLLSPGICRAHVCETWHVHMCDMQHTSGVTQTYACKNIHMAWHEWRSHRHFHCTQTWWPRLW